MLCSVDKICKNMQKVSLHASIPTHLFFPNFCNYAAPDGAENILAELNNDGILRIWWDPAPQSSNISSYTLFTCTQSKQHTNTCQASITIGPANGYPDCTLPQFGPEIKVPYYPY